MERIIGRENRYYKELSDLYGESLEFLFIFDVEDDIIKEVELVKNRGFYKGEIKAKTILMLKLLHKLDRVKLMPEDIVFYKPETSERKEGNIILLEKRKMFNKLMLVEVVKVGCSVTEIKVGDRIAIAETVGGGGLFYYLESTDYKIVNRKLVQAVVL